MTLLDDAIRRFQWNLEATEEKLSSDITFSGGAVARAVAASSAFDASRKDVEGQFKGQAENFANSSREWRRRAAQARVQAHSLVLSGFEFHHTLRMVGLTIKLRLLEVLAVVIRIVQFIAVLAIFFGLLWIIAQLRGR